LIYCEGIYKIYCTEVNINNSSVKYYLNNGDDKNEKPLIKCINNSCSTTEGFTGGYLDSEKKNLYYCESTTVCKIISKNASATPVYYLNNDVEKSEKPLIKCNNSDCITTKPPNVGFYNMNSNTNKLIDCNLIYCDLIYCDSSTCNLQNSSKYYLNDGDDKLKKPLIECGRRNCVPVKAPYIGYYINSLNVIKHWAFKKPMFKCLITRITTRASIQTSILNNISSFSNYAIESISIT